MIDRERSPTTRRTGSGRLFTSVGVATTPLETTRPGRCARRPPTDRYWPAQVHVAQLTCIGDRPHRQIGRPLTYRVRSYLTSRCSPGELGLEPFVESIMDGVALTPVRRSPTITLSVFDAADRLDHRRRWNRG